MSKDYVSKLSPEKCWSSIFPSSYDLGIRNLLYIVKLCLAAPLCNAESERVFWFLWRIFSKDRQSKKHETLEIIFHTRSDDGQIKESYRDVSNMFLNEYPEGTVRKRKRHLHGHEYPSHRASNKKSHHNAASVLLSISSDKEDKIRKLMPLKKYHLIVFQIMSGIPMMTSNW